MSRAPAVRSTIRCKTPVECPADSLMGKLSGVEALGLAAAFPRHFNVAVALSLGGIGYERTTVEVWVDAEIQGAIHEVEVDSEDIGLTMISRNVPSANPRTSRIVAPSVLAALRGLVAPVIVGS